VASARIAWAPRERLELEKLAPVPIEPSRLDVQARVELRSPLSRSLALPEKETASPGLKLAPAAGATTVTVGSSPTANRCRAELSSTPRTWAAGMD
jgi:hypothetical protein